MRAGRSFYLIVVAVMSALTSSSAFGQAAAKYVYDEAGRLKSVTYLDGTQALYGLDAAGNRVSVSTGANTTPPSAPTGLSGTATSSTQVNLTWSGSSDSGFLAGYKIFRNGSLLGIVAGSPPAVPPTSYTDLTTTCNVTYSYTVEAYDTANPPNVSGPSAAFSVTPPTTIPPSVPTGLAKGTVSATQVVLTWSASTDPCGSAVAGYNIYRNGALIGTSAGAGYTDTTASGATSYTYTVAAFDSVTPTPNTSGQSAGLAVITPPAAPGSPTATAIEPNYVTITWTAVSGGALTGYKIYRNGTLLTTVAAGVTTYNDTTTTGQTSYAYAVTAYDSAGESAQAAAPVITTPFLYQITGPGGTVLAPVASLYRSAGPVPGTCGVVAGAGPCQFFVYQTYGSQSAVRTSTNSIQACPYSDILAPGYTAGSGAEGTPNSCLATYVTPSAFGQPTVSGTPTGLTATASSATSVSLSWTAATDVGGPGLAGYKVYRNGSLLASTTGASPTYVDSTASCNVTYSYTVASYDTATPPDVSAQSTAASVATPIGLPPSVPTGLAASSVGSSQVVLTWSASSDPCGVSVGGYRIYRNGTQVGTSATTSYTDTSVIGASTYSYTVAAYDSSSAANASAQSSALNVTTLAQPYQITDSFGNVISAASSLYRSSIVPAVCGPSSGNGPCNYVVYQKYGAQLQVRMDTSTSPTGPWNNTYIAPGYSIGSGATEMATYGSAATYGGYLPPSTPASLTGSAASSSQVNLSWGASTDTSGVLAGYQLFRNGAQIATTAATSYSDTTTTCNTAYSYTVRAYDTFSPPDVSGLSPAFAVTTPITVAPSVPSGLSASSVTASQVVLVWNASSDSCAAVAGYRIYRNGTQIATSAGTSYTDTTVAGGTTYTYTVAAYDSTGANASSQSSPLSVTTPASIFQITNSTGQSLSSLYSTKIVPAICGPTGGEGPCNYVVTEISSGKAVRQDSGPSPTGPWTNDILLSGYSIGTGSNVMVTYATAAVYGK